MGGAGRLLLTALSAGASGNVTGGTGEMLQASAVNFAQGLAAQGVKLAAGDDDATRALLHAAVGCLGAAGQGGDCGSGALGGSGAVALNLLLDQLQGVNGSELTATEKEARSNLVASLLAGAAGASGGDAGTVGTAGKLETENNSLLPPSLMEFGSAATFLGIDMVEKGASSEEISHALYKQALGDLPKNQQPATLIAEGSAVLAGFTFGLMGAPVLTATGVAVGAVGGAAFNLWEQYDEAEKAAQAGKAYEFDKFSFALDTTIGGLTSGKGVLRTASLVWAGDMFYGYVKNEDKTHSSLASAGGAAAGQMGAVGFEKYTSKKLGDRAKSVVGVIVSGTVSSEVESFLNE